MKQIFTFQNILAFVLALMAGFNVTDSFKAKKGLGEMKIPAFGGFKYADKTQFFTFLICGVLWGSLAFLNRNADDGLAFILAFGAAIILFLISSMVNLFTKPGFYENGIATGSGILPFKGIKNYSIAPKKNDPDAYYIYFNQNGGFFSGSLRMVVSKDDVVELKKVLKKKASFK